MPRRATIIGTGYSKAAFEERINEETFSVSENCSRGGRNGDGGIGPRQRSAGIGGQSYCGNYPRRTVAGASQRVFLELADDGAKSMIIVNADDVTVAPGGS